MINTSRIASSSRRRRTVVSTSTAGERSPVGGSVAPPPLGERSPRRPRRSVPVVAQRLVGLGDTAVGHAAGQAVLPLDPPAAGRRATTPDVGAEDPNRVQAGPLDRGEAATAAAFRAMPRPTGVDPVNDTTRDAG